jgi:hypothetical protein
MTAARHDQGNKVAHSAFFAALDKSNGSMLLLERGWHQTMQCTIPNEHRDRVIAARYVREMVGHSGGIGALALTGAAIRRLESGK